ncbi:MAG: hypothetical protein U0704_16435 [Candidatus Eisenbacteria bacterium]
MSLRALGLAVALLAAASGEARAQANPDSTPARRPHHVLAWPLVVNYEGDEGRSLQMLGPVTGRFRSPRTRAAYLAFPVTGGFDTADGRRERWLAWPLTGWRSDSRRGLTELSLATPLVGWASESNAFRSRRELAPLWSDERRLGGYHAWQVTPLAYRRVDPARGTTLSEFGVLPGLGGSGLALARKWRTPDASGWNAALLWGHRADRRGGWTSVFPYVSNVWHDSLRGDSGFHGVVPVYGHWYRPDHTLTLALPGWWSWRSERLRSVGVWPLWSSFRRVRADSSVHAGGSIAWPLVSWGQGDEYSAVGLLPLWYRLRDGETRFESVAPLWFSLHRPGLDARMFTPLHVRWHGARDSLAWYGPWYSHRGPAGTTTGFLPLWEDRTAPGYSRRYVFPSWYARTDSAGDRRMLVPFWGRVSERRSGNVTRFYGPVVTLAGPNARGRGVVPVWYSGRDTLGRTLWVGPWLQRDFDDGGRRRALLPVGWYERTATATALHVLPFSGYVHRRDGYRYDYVLWPVWARRVQPDGARRSSLLLWLGRDERRGTRHRQWLQPLWYFDRTDDRNCDLDLLGGLLASYRETPERRRWKVLLVPVWSKAR